MLHPRRLGSHRPPTTITTIVPDQASSAVCTNNFNITTDFPTQSVVSTFDTNKNRTAHKPQRFSYRVSFIYPSPIDLSSTSTLRQSPSSSLPVAQYRAIYSGYPAYTKFYATAAAAPQVSDGARKVAIYSIVIASSEEIYKSTQFRQTLLCVYDITLDIYIYTWIVGRGGQDVM